MHQFIAAPIPNPPPAKRLLRKEWPRDESARNNSRGTTGDPTPLEWPHAGLLLQRECEHIFCREVLHRITQRPTYATRSAGFLCVTEQWYEYCWKPQTSRTHARTKDSMMNKTNNLAIATALLGVSLTVDSASALTNGSFESPATGCQGATTSLPGWSVTTGNIDIVDSTCTGMAAADGAYFLDLTGTVGSGAGGTITQSIATTPGSQYTLNFYFGGNSQWQAQAGNPFSEYQNDGPIKSMDVLIDGAQLGATYSINTTGNLWTNTGWVYETTTFKATGSSTTLAFEVTVWSAPH